MSLSEETKRKMSEAHRGRHHSEETKALISKRLLGRKLSDERVAKMKGRKTSEATRLKMVGRKVRPDVIEKICKTKQIKRELRAVGKQQCHTCHVYRDLDDFKPGRVTCSRCLSRASKRYRNPEVRERAQSLYRENRSHIRAYRKQYEHDYYLNNIASAKASRSEWYKKNKTSVIKRGAAYQRQRSCSDTGFRLLKSMRHRVHLALKSRDSSKASSTTVLIGCTIEELKHHLESKFTSGMTWENYGKWHVDHIRPCASFDLNNPEEQKVCFHYSNLQPLWARDNIVKGSSVSAKT